MKGLDQFLAKIRANPRATLISRYLTLVAELKDDGEKAERALDLAESLVKARPQETLRLAHMVFTADRTNLRALDLLIAAMEARGRAGKAEVLKIERVKLQKELAANPVREPSARLPQALFEPVGDEADGDDGDFGQDGEVSRIAEIDLGPMNSPEGKARNDVEPVDVDVLARLFPSDPVVHAPKPAPAPLKSPLAPVAEVARQAAPRPESVRSDTVVSSVAVQLDMLEGMPEHKPIDTVLPGGLAVPSTPDQMAPTLHLGASVWRTASPEQRPARQAPPPRVAPTEDTQPRELPAAAPESFWQTVQSELVRLTARAPALLVPFSRVERVESMLTSAGARPALPTLPDSFIRQLVELDHGQPGEGGAHALELKWNFVQAFFGGGADPRVVPLLEAMGLTEASPGFFGCYLDGLLAGGRARRAGVEMRRILAKRPHLAWAHVVWGRLPRLWTLQKVYGFQWSEDDGVPALQKLLAKRPKPKLASLVAAGLKVAS